MIQFTCGMVLGFVLATVQALIVSHNYEEKKNQIEQIYQKEEVND